MPSQPAARIISRILFGLGALLWAGGLVRILFPHPALDMALSAMLVAFVAVAQLRTGWQNRILCLALGAGAAALAGSYDVWRVIPAAIARAAVFPAFLGTIVLLRATAEQRPEVAAARRLFTALDPARRGGGLTVGANLLSGVLQMGALAILAPIVGRDASEDERRAVFLAAARGLAMTPAWSPFVVAMAVATSYMPHVRLWQIMPLGITLSAIAAAISMAMFDKGGIAAHWRALGTLAPIVPPVAIAAAIVVAMTALTPLTTLEALVVAMPLPCLLAIRLSPGGNIRAALRMTRDGLTRIGPETSILSFALTLGLVFEAALPRTGLVGWLEGLSPSPATVILAMIFLIDLFGLLAIHPIVTGTILLVAFTSVSTGVSDIVLMQAMLLGWGLCTPMSLGSLTVVTGSAMFDIPPARLISAGNIIYVVLTSAVLGLLLALLNPLLAA